jgi:predicted extracellular nuclease
MSIISLKSQSSSTEKIRVVFYNVENLFDTIDDPDTNDDEFTPEGKLRWTNKRYLQKINHTAQAITAVGGWKPPEIICLSEIENRTVLEDLIKRLNLTQYKIVHQDSKDKRGIDVSIIYNSSKLELLNHEFIETPELTTRDILYSQFKFTNNQTLHVLVNHWPSRRGGKMKSENKRVLSAEIVREKVDEIFNKDLKANILICGDFNDYAFDKSIAIILNKNQDLQLPKDSELINISAQNKSNQASSKYKGKWNSIDHLIVSPNLLNNSMLYTKPEWAKVFEQKFLLQKDRKYGGLMPFRTYSGQIYKGGYSDHLPLYIDFEINHYEF